MLFNSFRFAIFLPIVFILYWWVPKKYQWLILMISSFVFYISWNPIYFILIGLVIVETFIFARFIEIKPELKKLWLDLSIGICIIILFIFKYYNFIAENFSNFLGLHINTLNLLLPVGVSFYIFQAISYVVDVYRGESVEKNLCFYATYISFFPQLVAGPIERVKTLLPQIKEHHNFNSETVLFGLKLMVWGFFKKIVVADNLAEYVNMIFDDVIKYQGFTYILGILFFTIQIYCDFSGYTDIARGVAKLFGIKLMHNFRSPYFSSSLGEFWNRWHISLSTWFRDYVYIPLGGKNKHRNRNLLLTFTLSGLWHGANWTFLVWGFMHGTGVVLENSLELREKGKKWIRISITLLFVMIGWLIFRSHSISEAVYIIRHCLDGISHPYLYIWSGFTTIGIEIEHIVFCIFVYLMPLFVFDYLGAKNNLEAIEIVERWNGLSRWLFYLAMLLIIVFFSQKGVAAEFVYFQF